MLYRNHPFPNKLMSIQKIILISRIIAGIVLSMIPMGALSQPCLDTLRKQGYDYDFKNDGGCGSFGGRGGGADCDYIRKHLNDFQTLRHESDIHNKDISKMKWVGNHLLEEKNGTPVTTISATLTTASDSYDCVHKYKTSLECGPFHFYQSTAQGKKIWATPFQWNRMNNDYNLEGAIYNDREYSIISANNGAIVIEGEVSNMQPSSSAFPIISHNSLVAKQSASKPEILASSFKEGGWLKYRQSCSIEKGSVTVHVMKMILFPSRKYWAYVQNWYDSTYPNGALWCAKDKDCVDRMRQASNSMSIFLKQEEVYPVILQISVTAPAIKKKFDF